MEQFLKMLLQLPELTEIADTLAAGRTPIGVSGLAPVHKALVAAALAMQLERPLVALCADESGDLAIQQFCICRETVIIPDICLDYGIIARTLDVHNYPPLLFLVTPPGFEPGNSRLLPGALPAELRGHNAEPGRSLQLP